MLRCSPVRGLLALFVLLSSGCAPVFPAPDATVPGDAGPDEGGPPDGGMDGCTASFRASFDTASGATVWRGTPHDDEALGLAVGPDGSLWVVGYQGGVNNARLLPSGAAQGVVARYGRDGVLLGEWLVDSEGADTVEDLVIDESGEAAWVLGRTTGALPGAMSAGQYDAFLARLEPNVPVPVRALQFGTERPEHPRRLEALPGGRFRVAGFSDLYVPTNYVEAWEDSFVAELVARDDSLEVTRFERGGSDAPDVLSGLATDPRDGSYYVSGVRLEGPGRGPFVEKRSEKGRKLWEKHITPIGIDGAAGVLLDDNGDVVVAGSSALRLGDASYGEQDVFILKLDAGSGETLWTMQAGGDQSDWVTDVALGADGTLWVVGETLGSVGAGVENAGSFDVMLLAFDANGRRIGAWQWGTSGDDHAAAVAVDGCGRAYVAGYASGALLPETAWQGGRDLFVLSVDRPQVEDAP